jgi:hypothetical protein
LVIWKRIDHPTPLNLESRLNIDSFMLPLHCFGTACPQYSIALYPGGRCVPIGRADCAVYRGLYALAGVDIVDVAFGADFFLALTSTVASHPSSTCHCHFVVATLF